MKPILPVEMKRYYGWLFLTGFVLLAAIDGLGFLDGLDHGLYDLAFRLRGAQSPPDRIVIVAIDDPTLKAYGRWPLPRRHYATLLQQLSQADAVGFNLIFAESTPDDAAFAEVLAQSPNVVLPVYIDPHLSLSYPAHPFAAAKTGHIHLELDVDGILRRVFHSITYQDSIVASIAAQLAMLAGIRPPFVSNPDNLTPITATDRDIRQSHPAALQYYGGRSTFPYLSFHDVTEGRISPHYFKQKIVLVGVTAAGIDHGVLTPYTQDRNSTPAVEIQATILANLLENRVMRESPTAQRWIGALLISSLAFWAFVRWGNRHSLWLWLTSMMLLAIGAYVLFVDASLWIRPTLGLMALTAALALASVCNLDRVWAMLRQSKDDWEASFHAINDGIIIFDQSSRLTQINPVARDTFDASFLDHLQQRSHEILHHPLGPILPLYADAHERHDLPFTQEHYDPTTGKYLEIKSHLQLNLQSRPQGVVHVVRDLTDHHRSAAEHDRLQAQLLQAQKMEAMGLLAGGIAHDFNNILAAIKGFTDLAMISLPATHKARDDLQQVQRGSDRAKELVQQILAFSRQTPPEKKPVEVGAIVQEVLHLLRSSSPKSIEIRYRDTASSTWVHADPSQLHQVVMNLCTNALHAMSEEPGVLQLTLLDAHLDKLSTLGLPDLYFGPHLQFSVSDTGYGIDPADLNQVFDPFFTTKEPGKGTGLGLAVVHGIIKDHHGAIQVSSTPSQGTTFDIYLPRAMHEMGDQPVQGALLPTGTERLLVIDDDPSQVATWQAMGLRLGYDVTPTSSPLEALRWVRDDPARFDIILTDLMMPHMNGDVLAQKLHLLHPSIPILLGTGFSDAMTQEQAQEREITRVLYKPISIQELASALRFALERSK